MFLWFFHVMGTCFLMNIGKSIASEDKIACFFLKNWQTKRKRRPRKQRRAYPTRAQSTPKEAKELVAGADPFLTWERLTETGPWGG